MKNINKAMKYLKRARELLSRTVSPFDGMTDEAIIKKLRKTREEIWEEKLAHHS